MNRPTPRASRASMGTLVAVAALVASLVVGVVLAWREVSLDVPVPVLATASSPGLAAGLTVDPNLPAATRRVLSSPVLRLLDVAGSEDGSAAFVYEGCASANAPTPCPQVLVMRNDAGATWAVTIAPGTDVVPLGEGFALLPLIGDASRLAGDGKVVPLMTDNQLVVIAKDDVAVRIGSRPLLYRPSDEKLHPMPLPPRTTVVAAWISLRAGQAVMASVRDGRGEIVSQPGTDWRVAASLMVPPGTASAVDGDDVFASVVFVVNNGTGHLFTSVDGGVQFTEHRLPAGERVTTHIAVAFNGTTFVERAAGGVIVVTTSGVVTTPFGTGVVPLGQLHQAGVRTCLAETAAVGWERCTADGGRTWTRRLLAGLVTT